MVRGRWAQRAQSRQSIQVRVEGAREQAVYAVESQLLLRTDRLLLHALGNEANSQRGTQVAWDMLTVLWRVIV